MIYRESRSGFSTECMWVTGCAVKMLHYNFTLLAVSFTALHIWGCEVREGPGCPCPLHRRRVLRG